MPDEQRDWHVFYWQVGGGRWPLNSMGSYPSEERAREVVKEVLGSRDMITVILAHGDDRRIIDEWIAEGAGV